MDGVGDESSIALEGSLDPAMLPEVTLGAGTYGPEHNTPKARSPSGRLSPVRGRTIKEYDQQISELKKENFSLKMRIYYMEQRMYTHGNEQDFVKTNIELQVEIENLKKDLNDKQIFVQKAALAMRTLESNQRQAEEDMRKKVISEHSDAVNLLREQLDQSAKNYESSKKEADEAKKQVEMLIQKLEEAKDDLSDANKEKNELANRAKNMEFDIQTLTAQLKLSEQARQDKEKVNTSFAARLKDLEGQLQNAEKQIGRKDRDMEDQMDDQKEEIEKKGILINELQASILNKNLVIKRLEDALKDMESKLKSVEVDKEGKENDLSDATKKLEKYKKRFEEMLKSQYKKDLEFKALQEELDQAKEQIKKLQSDLRDAELEKTKGQSQLNSQLMDLEDNTGRLQRQLTEADERQENLIQSLGRKEGELEQFQSQLHKAMEALNTSEEAVEALQAQLTTERMEFETKLKEQALQFQTSVNDRPAGTPEIDGLQQQVAELQNLMTNKNLELLALTREKDEGKKLQEQLEQREKDIEKLNDDHEIKLAALEKNLSQLRAELTGRDYKIQALEEHKRWLEDYQKETVHEIAHNFHHRETHTTLETSGMSLDLLQDLKGMMDALKVEILALSQLHSRLNAEGVNADILVSEIASVQSIYKQLEDGVEKNSKLHQALLRSLRGDNRLSDSPDSNSVQDGGYNLGSNQYPDSTSSTEILPQVEADKQDRSRSFSPADSSHKSGECPGVAFIDRSLQAGYSVAQVDQWVQTSPRSNPGQVNSTDEWDGGPDTHKHGILKSDPQKAQGQSPSRPSPKVGTNSHSGLTGSGKSRVTFTDRDIGNGAARTSSSHFQNCLTDDAKGEHSLGLPEECHVFNHHTVLFDDHFDLRSHDRGSSVNPYLSGGHSGVQSGSSGEPSPISTAGESELGNDRDLNHQSSKQELNQTTDKSCNLPSNSPRNLPNGDGGLTSINGNISSGRGSTGPPSVQAEPENSIDRLVETYAGLSIPGYSSASIVNGHEKAEDEKRGSDRRSRRNSWAEELEEYKIHDTLRGDQNSTFTQQSESNLCRMTSAELQHLVVKLQEDLMQAVRQKRHLQRQLEVSLEPTREVPQSMMNGNHPDNKQPKQSHIPRLFKTRQGPTSSTCSDDSDSNTGTQRTEMVTDRSDQWRASSADRGLTLHNQLSQSHGQIQELQQKLQATENTVRLLSRKNKLYASALESAGVPANVLHRSNSETNLSARQPPRPRVNGGGGGGLMAMSTSNLDTLAAGDNAGYPSSLDHFVSPYKRPKISMSLLSAGSKEHAREDLHSSFNSLPNISLSQVRDNNTTCKTSASGSPHYQTMERPVHQTRGMMEAPVLVETACQTTSPWQSPSKGATCALAGETLLEMSAWDASYYPTNVTFHSMLDSTLINKTLANLSAVALDSNSSSVEALSREQLQVKVQYLESMNVTMKEEMRLIEALKTRSSCSTQVSPSPSRDTVGGSPVHRSTEESSYTMGFDITDDEEELLKQHLAEIRRLRQRLERLDLDKNPEQLLIFQSHFNQRITSQETIISNLQQQLRDQEDIRQRELVELQHRLSREKSLQVEELQHAISQLEKSIESQQHEVERLHKKEEDFQDVIADLKANLAASEKREEAKDERIKSLNADRSKLQTYLNQEKQNYMQLEDNAFSMEKSITEQQAQIEDLKYRLEVSEDRDRKKEEEIKKLVTERSELQTNLNKRESDFLELEENLFKMELSKETCEKECQRLETEVEASHKEAMELKKEIEEYRESSKHLKEIVIKREKSLQEKMQSLQKLSSENQVREHRTRQLEIDLEELRTKEEEQRHLQENMTRLEADIGRLQEDKDRVAVTLKEKEAKLQKRDRQLNHLITQYKKLEGAYIKLRTAWKEKSEMIKSLNRQNDYLKAMATCSSQEEKNSLMKKLVKELVATQQQVEDLLSRLESPPSGGNTSSSSIPTVRVETCAPDMGSFQQAPLGGAGITTTTIITSNNTSERTDTFLSVGLSEGMPVDTNSLTTNEEEEQAKDAESLPALSPINTNSVGALTAESEGIDGEPLAPVEMDKQCSAPSSPRKDASSLAGVSCSGGMNPGSLYAILKLELHEALRKQTGEALITFSGLEARIADRLKALKARPVTESMEYSTLREASMSCQNLKVCLQEASRLVNLAWISELPPTDTNGKFYNPLLIEENENLRHEVTRLKSRHDLLDHTVKEQQGRLDANKERHKLWEASLYRQLHKTTSDLEQAKENIDLSVRSLPGRPDRQGQPRPSSSTSARRSPLSSPSKYNFM